MRPFTTALLSASLLACSGHSTSLQVQVPAALTTEPAPDKAHPAAFDTFQIPSHGALLNAFVYIAAGRGPHTTVLLLHGFPGNERNIDVAQTLRRAGYDVVYFDYRGSWGSPGDFSFTHCIEDVESAIAYLRDPANAKRLRADSGSLILIGHSMGGFLARYVGAQDAAIKAVGMISASDLAVGTVDSVSVDPRGRTIEPIAERFAAEGMAPLGGTSPKALAEEVIANADAWRVAELAPKLSARPVLVITSDDGLTASNDAFVAALKKAGEARATTLHLATDHSYSGERIALQISILNWLAAL